MNWLWREGHCACMRKDRAVEYMNAGITFAQRFSIEEASTNQWSLRPVDPKTSSGH